MLLDGQPVMYWLDLMSVPARRVKHGSGFTRRTPELGDAEDAILAGMLLDDPDSAS